jgi:hypothetical protein
MNRVFIAALVGLVVISAAPSTSLAYHCVVRSTNGTSGWANRAERSELRCGPVLPLEAISMVACVILLIVAEGRSIQVAI